jgi:hypothetical protein
MGDSGHARVVSLLRLCLDEETLRGLDDWLQIAASQFPQGKRPCAFLDPFFTISIVV